MRSSRIKAILFDFGGTLDADGAAWKERFYPLYRVAGLRWSFPRFQKYFFASDDFITDLKPRDVSYADVLKLQVGLTLREGGAFREPLARRIAGKFLGDSLKSIRSKLPLIRRLKRKYQLGIVANFYGNLERVCRDSGLAPHFGVLADSARVGVIKPDRRIFLHALRALKARPEEALFVGDSVSRDMRGARDLGMRHVWIQGPQSRGLKPCCADDPVVKSVRELEKFL